MHRKLVLAAIAAALFAAFVVPSAASAHTIESTWTSVSSGYNFNCGLTSGGAVKCWGQNNHSQLGAASPSSSFTPLQIPGLESGVTKLSVGIDAACAIQNGNVVCWGAGHGGVLGNQNAADHATPQQVAGISGAKSIATGRDHACAVVSGGALKCWGTNSSGELGIGASDSDLHGAEQVPGLTSGVTDVSADQYMTCAVVSGGAKCWGYEQEERLGNGPAGPAVESSPVDVVGLGAGSGVTAISAGLYGACAIANQVVKCWGDGYGAGDATDTSLGTPITVAGLPATAKSIAVGENFTCATIATGAMCWGDNEYGRLGNGTNEWFSSAADVAGYTAGVKSLDVGRRHGCLVKDGEIHCWGDNTDGKLGENETTWTAGPQTIALGENESVGSIAAGLDFTCVGVNEYSAPGMRCWGAGSEGQLANGATTSRATPGDLIAGVKWVTAGTHFACGVAGTSTAQCWGRNNYGQLGSPHPPNNLTTPTDVSGLPDGADGGVAAGAFHSCAMDSGEIRCWGNNASGQLGADPSLVPSSDTPIDSNSLTIVQAITAGYDFTCAFDAANALYCWGANDSGQLGDGTNTASFTPQQVDLPAGYTVIAIDAGQAHACAILQNNTTALSTVWCWGDNSHGQLGDGTFDSSNEPVEVADLGSGPIELSVGWDTTCVSLYSGSVRCWGANGSGELGSGTEDSNVPVSVPGLLPTMKKLSVGYHHVCAAQNILISPKVQCWGSRISGALGDGKFQYAITPTTVVPAPSGIDLDLTPAEPNLGQVAVGASSTTVLTVTNKPSSTASWKYAGHNDFGDDGFTVDDGTCTGATLAPGASCTISVTLTGVEPGEVYRWVHPIAGNADSIFKAKVLATVVPAPVAPPAPPVPSISAPKSVKIGKSIPVKTTCAAGCTLNLKLKIGKKSVKVKAVKVKAGQTKATIKLPSSVVKKIKAAKKKKQKTTLTITPSGGGAAKKVTIK